MSDASKRVVSVLLSLAAWCSAASIVTAYARAQEVPPEERERIEFERRRQAYEDAAQPVVAPTDDHGLDAPVWFRAVDRVAAMGSEAVPFLEAELGSDDPVRRSFARFCLMHIPGDEATRILEAYVEALRDSTDRLAVHEKAWGCVALAAHGRIDALDCLQSGTPVASVDYVDGMTSLVAAALILGPPAREPLVQALAGVDPGSEAGQLRAAAILRALAAIPDPSLLPLADHWLGQPLWALRAATVDVLAAIGNAEAVSRLLRTASTDPDPRTQTAAAVAVEMLRPADGYDRVLLALESASDPYARGALYRALVAIDPERAVDALRSHRARPDASDRRLVLLALGQTHSTRALNLLREGLRDPDPTVAVAAVTGLAEIGSPGAVDSLLALIRDPRRVVSQAAVAELTAMGETRAAPRVADVLLNTTLSTRSTLLETRELVAIQTAALVRLRYTEPADDLAKRAAGVEDPEIRGTLTRTATLMREMRARGDDVDKWTAATADADMAVRALAYERLGEIGSPKAVAALVTRYEAAGVDRPDVVRALARSGSSDAAPLLHRIVASDELDVVLAAELRPWAAWGLRRAGGPAAAETLRGAALARHGREFPVLAYYAVLAGSAALPTLEAVRAPRVLWQGGTLAEDQHMLERAIRDLAAGRSVGYLDHEPGGDGHAH